MEEQKVNEGKVRSEYSARVSLSTDEISYLGVLVNISVNGALIEIENALEPGYTCSFRMHLGPDHMGLDIKGTIEVVRRTERGLAVRFTKLSEEVETHIHNLVKYHCSDLNKYLEQEAEDEDLETPPSADAFK